ncbi:MAG TPA: hypothetical protein VLA88_05510, partial [Candidatus Saccharimonadales bacterium]|nr:hypothetical protein [Candidatus Saccharimonadales bacterium]
MRLGYVTFMALYVTGSEAVSAKVEIHYPYASTEEDNCTITWPAGTCPRLGTILERAGFRVVNDGADSTATRQFAHADPETIEERVMAIVGRTRPRRVSTGSWLYTGPNGDEVLEFSWDYD